MEEIAPRPFSLDELSTIRIRYSLVDSGHRTFLIVSYDGTYRPGSEGNDDARFMYAAATAGLAAASASKVIFDFRTLNYVWGDMLEIVYNAASEALLDEPSFAVIVGDGCKEAIRTLELGEESPAALSSIPWAHETLEAAYDYLARG